MDIKVGDYIKLKKEYKDKWNTFQENPRNYPKKVEYIEACSTQIISTYTACMICPGRINGICYGRGRDMFIVEPTNVDWDE